MDRSQQIEELEKNIDVFEQMETGLKDGTVVVLYQGKLIGLYESEHVAIRTGRSKFGDAPFLVKTVGQNSVQMLLSIFTIGYQNGNL